MPLAGERQQEEGVINRRDQGGICKTLTCLSQCGVHGELFKLVGGRQR